ncbi:DUF2306 domain-containing protein [Rhodobaculum claviforme]|uniref:Uncharacterized protein n=1 Tax=Rhodobaculum claviforme TaxID=1549854 RepID=A0A934WJJ4_9RHOB|nr:DUF2306 domain-containing protein [Rhodobaculum claviforme]MBK5927568.1 hypothetical protein [Rhodobaculum claviforme]
MDDTAGGHGGGRRAGRWAALAGLALLWLLALPFVDYSVRFGLDGLPGPAARDTHLDRAGAALTNALMFAHMLTGAALTVLAPVQVLPVLRRRWPGAHRWLGRAIVALAGVTAVAGLAFIALRGTVGGAMMDVAFAGYGACLLVAAVQAPRFARARDVARHRAWALRLFVLAMGSFLYRLHYALWYITTGGAASRPDFTGAFDIVTMWAFYVPYLLALEVWLRRRS